MPNPNSSIKHSQIQKTNKRMFILLAVAATSVSFSVVASINLFNRLSYQGRVINEREQAETALQNNINNLSELTKAYRNFEDSNPSIIGTNEKNSKIILDALPSKYDFPALLVSMEKLMRDRQVFGIGIVGKDEEVTAAQSSADPKPVEISFTLSGSGNYETSMQNLISDMQRSIRPIVIEKISFSGNQANIKYTIDAKTYYQPEKKLEIPFKDVE